MRYWVDALTLFTTKATFAVKGRAKMQVLFLPQSVNSVFLEVGMTDLLAGIGLLTLLVFVFLFGVILFAVRRCAGNAGGLFNRRNDPLTQVGLRSVHPEVGAEIRLPYSSWDPDSSTPRATSATLKPTVIVIPFGTSESTLWSRQRTQQADDFQLLVDTIVTNADKYPGKIGEIVVTIESPGGGVQMYGHLFAAMERLRALEKTKIKLTVCVDECAASGGYLMALPAHQILAAPFAVVGSIGVVADIPNIRKLLQRVGIEPRTFTAGEVKRTITLTDDDTKENREHFQAKLERIHRLFISKLAQYRGDRVDTAKVTNGDHWTASESIALKLGLVDAIGTSAEYLFNLNKEHPIVYLTKKSRSFSPGALFSSAGVRLLRLLMAQLSAR